MNRTLILTGMLLLTAACADEPGPATPLAPAMMNTPAAQNAGLAEARRATARFQRFEIARDSAGYTVLFMNRCMVDESGANRGGMGFHYVNPELLDDKLDIAHPEAVLYEPESNGRLRLVALEYVIPAEAWTSEEPPELLGRKLTLNAFGLWALHTWIWKTNPSGMFADWNPAVDCTYAAAATTP